jgi:NADH dehydrogenase [ubiquinone] 1 alpha subcomplex assembly factor 6
MTLSYCGDLVRRHDPDRFLVSLLMPERARPALWALYAFNHEISRTREVVTDTRLGLIRLQWWREALGAGGNPVIDELRRYDLPRDVLEHLIYAREFDLEDRPPADIGGLLNYIDFTSTPLLSLGGKIAGETGGNDREIAIAHGLSALLRATPFHVKQSRCLLPGVDVHTLTDPRALIPIVRTVRIEAERLLATPPQGRLQTLHAKLARIHLTRLRACGDDVFHPRLAIPPLALGVRLWWASQASKSSAARAV